jgi:hypothetical protein
MIKRPSFFDTPPPECGRVLRLGLGRDVVVTPAWPAGAARPDAYRFGVVGHAGHGAERGERANCGATGRQALLAPC